MDSLTELFRIIKENQDKYGLDIKFVIGIERGIYTITDIINSTGTSGYTPGIGQINIKSIDNEFQDFYQSLETTVKSLVRSIEISFTDSIESGNIDINKTGSIDNSFRMMHLNKFGVVPLIMSDSYSYEFCSTCGRATQATKKIIKEP